MCTSVVERRLSDTGATQKECQAWIQRIREEISSGLPFRGIKFRVADFQYGWLVLVSSSRTKITFNQYRWIIPGRIIPHTRADFSSFYRTTVILIYLRSRNSGRVEESQSL
jgi:hypothetical protein